MGKFISILLLLLFQQVVKSQESISLSYNYGIIAVHSPSIEPLINGPVHGFTVNYAFSNKRGTDWRKLYNFPDYGISYNYKDYNNANQLGNSHSITGFFQMPFLQKGRFFNLGFKGFAGVGIFTKKYDAITNPLNKAISSTINISADARLYSRINFYPLFLEYSFGLNHFSNGLIKAPNLGINVINNNFAVGYYLEDKLPYEEIKNRKTERTENYEVWAVTTFGLKELDSDSRKYMFSGLTVNFAKYLSQINKLGIGIDFLNDPSLVPTAYNQYHYIGASDLNFRYGINLNHEFILGNTGFFAAYGFYFRHSDYYTSNRYYKAGFKYYYKNVIGMVLIRAIPLFRADVVEFGVGYKVTTHKKNH